MSDQLQPLEPGTYPVTIVDFGTIIQSRHDGLWFLPVLTDTQDARRLVAYVGASLAGIRMLLAQKKAYVGMEARMKLRHRIHNSVLTYSCDLLWERDNAGDI